ncbi:MAG: YjbE family putative metal transport protein [Rhodospirillaceae bacterium]|nr:YjbE family putative metal transport protein [Rhodospirillaceae bacterium]MBT5663879.1 YjbE family putative metal transport protein [Rhodospirillaceae bacterium]MBT5812649.1 YjbE family putative metal transport protein [Rhodospirillaceae bacterium]
MLQFDAATLWPLFQIIVIDIVLSADNAIIVGVAAAGLPADLRRRAIVFGIAGAAVIRIICAVFVVQLLSIIGLLLAGGLLLAWVCWRMWRELRSAEAESDNDAALKTAAATTMTAAMVNIIVADVTMSLDNVLAVAGAARDNVELLVFGLVLSVALMGAVANYVAKLIQDHKWIAYVGLIVIVYVAGNMIWRGATEIQTEVLSENVSPITVSAT